MLNKYPQTILVVLFCLIACSSLRASHILGLSVEYTHVDSDLYEVKITFDRYCGGTFFSNGTFEPSAPAPASINYGLVCDGQFLVGGLVASLDTLMDQPIWCNANELNNTCLSGTLGFMGKQKAEYLGLLDLSEVNISASLCDELNIFTGSYARIDITNVALGIEAEIYTHATLFPTSGITNSSIQFQNLHSVPFFYDQHQYHYNWAYTNPDNDSLHWSFDTAWSDIDTNTGVKSAITYVSPYTPMSPMPGPIMLDANTGALDFTAEIPAGYNYANYVIALRVEEYDRTTGDLKGIAFKDVQFWVFDSASYNPAPINPGGIDSIVGNAYYLDSNVIAVCDPDSVILYFEFYDYDGQGLLGDSTINLFSNIQDLVPGAYYDTIPATVNPTILKMAIPTDVLQTQFAVNFWIQAIDSNCPFLGYSTYNYSIRRGAATTFSIEDTSICNLDTIPFQGENGATFLWSSISGETLLPGTNIGCLTCDTNWLHFDSTTTLVVESDQSGLCANKDTVTVEVFEKYPLDITPLNGGTVSSLVYCSSDSMDQFQVLWNLGYFAVQTGLDSFGVLDPALLDPGIGQNQILNIVYTIEGNCANMDSVTVRVKGLPDAMFNTVGPYEDSLLFVQLQGVSNISGTWTDVNGSTNPTVLGAFNPSLLISPDSVLVQHLVSDSGCQNVYQDWVKVVNDSASGSLIIAENFGVIVFPNPATSQLSLVASGGKVIQSVELIDEHGRPVLKQHVAESSATLNLSRLPKGSYMVLCHFRNGGQEAGKVIIE